MTADATAFLQKARQFLDKAQSMLGAGWPDEAGRAAYLAGFHAAQGLIASREASVPRTHGGVQARFAHHLREEDGFAPELRRFLGRAYALKTLADYEVEPALPVTPERAEAAMRDARAFVAAVTRLLVKDTA